MAVAFHKTIPILRIFDVEKAREFESPDAPARKRKAAAKKR